MYLATPGAQTIQAAAHAATAGFVWLVNPVASGKVLILIAVYFETQLTSALVALTAPRLVLERMTFTGAPGAAIPATPTVGAIAATGVLSAAAPGSPTAGTAFHTELPIASATAVAYSTPAVSNFRSDPEDPIQLTPGQGVVLRQADAGTAADTRRLATSWRWKEWPYL